MTPVLNMIANFTEAELAAIQRVALHAFLDDLGVEQLMRLNADGLVRFREQHGLDVHTMNIAWTRLQAWLLARDAAAQARVLRAFGA